MPESVHLCSFPDYNETSRDHDLEASMKAVQTVVSLGHTLRKEHKLKVRQPLPAVHIASGEADTLKFLEQQQHLIEEELNVKKVIFHNDESAFVDLKVKPNFRVLGKKWASICALLNKRSILSPMNNSILFSKEKM